MAPEPEPVLDYTPRPRRLPAHLMHPTIRPPVAACDPSKMYTGRPDKDLPPEGCVECQEIVAAADAALVETVLAEFR